MRCWTLDPMRFGKLDHTLLDIPVQRDGENPAQPWLTVVLDDYSRAVAGYFLFFEAPPLSVIETL
jgi:putative transposase